ncbi:protein MOS2-like [Oryza brachyantha]|uniref:protein MOS2-like n=1 Tax=Oryza brachyantha TaxID=4533 RepID=UPI001ADA61DF|nr:protein MOS2-like [Oryza brachyantha]XP_040377824.1 protein MOS2-like [Oryza brachyantha]XP_040377825.1 protein MOS2-like [Oryza brachyantha]
MEKEKKLSFSIPSKARPPRPASRPAAAAAEASDGGEHSASSARAAPAPQFVTEFDPTQTLATGPAPAVIAPLQNSGHFLNHRSRKPSSLPTPEEEAALAASAAGGPSFVLDTSTAPDNPSSHIAYGLTVRNAAAESERAVAPAAATEPEKTPPPPADAPGGDLMLRRYKEDMASLPDHRGLDEFLEVPVEGFGAALLAGYGWSEGKGIGRNNKGDTKVVEYDRRAGTQGLGYNPSEADPKKTRSGEWVVGGKKETQNGNAKKRDHDSRSRTDGRGSNTRYSRGGTEDRDSSAHQKRSSERRAEREVQEKVRNSRDTRQVKIGGGGGDKVRWLHSDIRVRVVSERLSKRLYLKKGKVLDVVGPTTCDIIMDDRSELVQGVEQDMLETVLPRTNGLVLLLGGEHKGMCGHLIEKNSEEETGVVELSNTKDMLRVKYDQIAEYIGDPESLEY